MSSAVQLSEHTGTEDRRGWRRRCRPMPPSLARPEEFMSSDEQATPQESAWRWPREPDWLQSARDRAAALAEARLAGLPEALVDNDGLRRAAIASPDDDAPRHAYAAWLAAQEHEFAQLLGAFIAAQLRVAEAFRADRRAEVAALRRWRGDDAYVAHAAWSHKTSDLQRSSCPGSGRTSRRSTSRGQARRPGRRTAGRVETSRRCRHRPSSPSDCHGARWPRTRCSGVPVPGAPAWW